MPTWVSSSHTCHRALSLNELFLGISRLSLTPYLSVNNYPTYIWAVATDTYRHQLNTSHLHRLEYGWLATWQTPWVRASNSKICRVAILFGLIASAWHLSFVIDTARLFVLATSIFLRRRNDSHNMHNIGWSNQSFTWNYFPSLSHTTGYVASFFLVFLGLGGGRIALTRCNLSAQLPPVPHWSSRL